MRAGLIADGGEMGEFSLRGGFAMHDFVVALVFVALVMAPCVVGMTTKFDDLAE